MRYLVGFLTILVVAASSSAAAGNSSTTPAGHGSLRQAEMMSAVNREDFDTRAAHLARAALEGQQADTLTREELVSLMVLMSLQQAPHRPHS